jgi:hypothetical protein
MDHFEEGMLRCSHCQAEGVIEDDFEEKHTPCPELQKLEDTARQELIKAIQSFKQEMVMLHCKARGEHAADKGFAIQVQGLTSLAGPVDFSDIMDLAQTYPRELFTMFMLGVESKTWT